MRNVCCRVQDPERRKLKKIRDFLNKNRSWICDNDCDKADPQCDICTMVFLIDRTYSVNKKSSTKTFINSYLWEPFVVVEKTYDSFQNKTWNSLQEERKKEKIMENSSFCICM